MDGQFEIGEEMYIQQTKENGDGYVYIFILIVLFYSINFIGKL